MPRFPSHSRDFCKPPLDPGTATVVPPSSSRDPCIALALPGAVSCLASGRGQRRLRWQVHGVTTLEETPCFPLSWGRGGFGRLRPKSVRGLPGNHPSGYAKASSERGPGEGLLPPLLAGIEGMWGEQLQPKRRARRLPKNVVTHLRRKVRRHRSRRIPVPVREIARIHQRLVRPRLLQEPVQVFA